MCGALYWNFVISGLYIRAPFMCGRFCVRKAIVNCLQMFEERAARGMEACLVLLRVSKYLFRTLYAVESNGQRGIGSPSTKAVALRTANV
jgi:hypothetical protein